MSWVTLVAHKGNEKILFRNTLRSKGKQFCAITAHVLRLTAAVFQSLFEVQPFFPSATTRRESTATPDCWNGPCASQYWDNSNSEFWSQPCRSGTLKNRSEAYAKLNFIRGCAERITGVKQYLLLPPGEQIALQWQIQDKSKMMHGCRKDKPFTDISK